MTCPYLYGMLMNREKSEHKSHTQRDGKNTRIVGRET